MLMVRNTDRNIEASQGSGGAIRDREEFASPSLHLIYAIADLTDSDPATMPPLYDAIDTDALDTLLDTESSIEIGFEYDGHSVTVTGDGEVRVDGQAHRSEWLTMTSETTTPPGAERNQETVQRV